MSDLKDGMLLLSFIVSSRVASMVGDNITNQMTGAVESRASIISALIGRSTEDVETGTESTNLTISAMQVISECIQSIKVLMDEIALASAQLSNQPKTLNRLA